MNKASALLEEIRQSVAAVGKDTGDRLGKMEDRLTSLERNAQSRAVSVPGTGVDDPGRFSFAKMIWAKKTGDWSFAPYEKEVLEAAKTRALASQSGAGSDLVPVEVMAEIIPLLRSRWVLDALPGLRRIDGVMGGSIKLPRTITGSTGYWVGENAAITASDSDDDQLTFTPHKAAGLCKFSNTMLRTGIASGGVEDYVRQEMARTLARTVQVGFFLGSGSSSQPTGLLNIASINTVAMSAVSTKALLVTALQNMQKELEVDNVSGPSLAWVFHPRAFWKMSQLLVDGTSGAPLLTGPGSGNITAPGDPGQLLGIPYFKTTDMQYTAASPANCDILLALFEEIILMTWGTGIEVAVATQASDAFEKDQTWIRNLWEVDVQAMHKEAICVGTDFPVA